MIRIFGFFVMVVALAWPGLVLGQEYVFGKDNDTWRQDAHSGASAGNGGKIGVYLAPRFMDSLINTGEISSGARAGKYCNTFGGALAVGYYFNQMAANVPLRMELEYAFRSDARASWNGSGSTGTQKFEALFNVQTLQANLYWDIDISASVKPFVGIGLGASSLYASYKARDYEGNSHSYDDTTMGLAWNIGAGLGYEINETVTADLAYRFAGFGHAEAQTGGSTTRNYMTAHEFILGLRLNF